MKKFTFFGGKGGVGKTTCSAAYAYSCSIRGLKTLVVSTDPAHSLEDIFEKKIGPEPIEINKNLFALEIDSEKESKSYIDNIKLSMSKLVSPVIISEIERQLDAASVSPGTEEAAIFDKLVEIMVQHSSEYEKIVFDTAPTGHTLRLLSLPELLGAWLDKLIQKRKKALELTEMSKLNNINKVNNDPILQILGKRKEKLEKARALLLDTNQVSFVFVLNAEKLPIQETKKAVAILDKYQIPISHLIVNRLLPETTTDPFWQNRKQLEQRYLIEIEETFKGKILIKLPLLKTDMRANTIEQIAQSFNCF